MSINPSLDTSTASIKVVLRGLRGAVPEWFSAELLEAVVTERDDLAAALTEAKRKLALLETTHPRSTADAFFCAALDLDEISKRLLHPELVIEPKCAPNAPDGHGNPRKAARQAFSEVLAERDKAQVKAKELAAKLTARAALLDQADSELSKCVESISNAFNLFASLSEVLHTGVHGSDFRARIDHARDLSAALRAAIVL